MARFNMRHEALILCNMMCMGLSSIAGRWIDRSIDRLIEMGSRHEQQATTTSMAMARSSSFHRCRSHTHTHAARDRDRVTLDYSRTKPISIAIIRSSTKMMASRSMARRSTISRWSSTLATLLVVVVCCSTLGSTQNATFDHSNWQQTLDRYLKPNTTIAKIDGSNTLDYQGLRKAIALAPSSEPTPFTSYLAQLAAISSLDDYSIDEQFAIFINAYNAFAVNMVLQHPCKTLFGKVFKVPRSRSR